MNASRGPVHCSGTGGDGKQLVVALKLHYSRAGRLLPKGGDKSVITFYPNHRRLTMQWTAPSFTDLRFGFEITMYIANR